MSHSIPNKLDFLEKNIFYLVTCCNMNKKPKMKEKAFTLFRTGSCSY